MKEQIKKKEANDALMGLIVSIVGFFYLIMTMNLKDASVGGAQEPKFFPLIIAAILIILGLYFLLKTGISQLKVSALNISKALKIDGDIYFTIAITSVNCIVYALLFKRIGYVLSTFIFLEVMMFITRKEKWVSNLIISTLFTVSIYFIFSKMLGVMLPPMPFLDI